MPFILNYLKNVDDYSLEELKVATIYSAIIDYKKKYYEILLGYNLVCYLKKIHN